MAGPSAPRVTALLHLAKFVHEIERNPAGAEPLFREALRTARAFYSADLPDVSTCLFELARDPQRPRPADGSGGARAGSVRDVAPALRRSSRRDDAENADARRDAACPAQIRGSRAAPSDGRRERAVALRQGKPDDVGHIARAGGFP